MNLDWLKNKIKSNPKLECVYLCAKSMKDVDLAKKMIGVKEDPNTLIVNNFGELNKDIIIYYILFDKDASYSGFCSMYRHTLLYIAYAKYMGLVPYVFYGPSTLYYDQSIEFPHNAFEYYFEPISDVDDNSILKSKKVVISKAVDAGAFGRVRGYGIDVSEDEITLLGKIQRENIRLTQEVKSMFWDEMTEYTSEYKTIGIHVRATDYNKGYNRHPVVVTPDEYLEKAKEACKLYGFERVFLATDDNSVIDLFRKQFGERLFYYADSYRSTNGEAIHYGYSDTVRNNHKYLLGLEIIKDFYTLGYCDGLIAGKSNVSQCARIIKESQERQYTHLNIIDKGVYHTMKETRNKKNGMLKHK